MIQKTNPLIENMEDVVFALDIGTRSIVGVLGTISDDAFIVFDYEQRFHQNRAMRDGQIEDIYLVSRTVNEVKEALEARNAVSLTKVSIAAAGRSLKTVRASYEQNLIEDDDITEALMHSIEYGAVSAALDQFTDATVEPESGASALPKDKFSCVGYNVMSYKLDNYPLNNPEGHRGKHLDVEIIAAFLPFSVVRSLYSVTERCGLAVDSLTLEPIAAINAVVPPDIRLLNIAIVDIGAGTSDIGLSKNGSIIAYDMVTTAGDEITEAIMRQYLVDFNTAEAVKRKLSGEADEVSFSDILGIGRVFSVQSILESIGPAIDKLSESITSALLKVNDGPPTALFLVGGGSQIPTLCARMAQALNLPEERVTLGGKHPYKSIIVHTDSLLSPEFVTPLGIGATSRLTHIHDLFSVSVNGEKVTLPGTETIKVFDALLLAGIKSSNLIGHAQSPLVYYLNGEMQTVRGTPPVPGELYVNNTPATLDTVIRQGDSIIALFAQNGKKPVVTLADLCDLYSGPLDITVNSNPMPLDYLISQGDDVRIAISAQTEVNADPADPNEAEAFSQIRVSINGEWVSIPIKENLAPLFVDMLPYTDVDKMNPRGDLILTINDRAASYTDKVSDGDIVQIRWSE